MMSPKFQILMISTLLWLLVSHAPYSNSSPLRNCCKRIEFYNVLRLNSRLKNIFVWRKAKFTISRIWRTLLPLVFLVWLHILFSFRSLTNTISTSEVSSITQHGEVVPKWIYLHSVDLAKPASRVIKSSCAKEWSWVCREWDRFVHESIYLSRIQQRF